MKLLQHPFLHDLRSLVPSIRFLRATEMHIFSCPSRYILDSLTPSHPWMLFAGYSAVLPMPATTSPLSFLSMMSKHESEYIGISWREAGEGYRRAQRQTHLTIRHSTLNSFLRARCYDSFYVVLAFPSLPFLSYPILSYPILSYPVLKMLESPPNCFIVP